MGLIKRGALFRKNDLFLPFQTIKWQIKQNKQVEVFLMRASQKENKFNRGETTHLASIEALEMFG